MFARFLSVTLVVCAVLGLAVAPSAFGSMISYVDIDTATKAGWRTTTVAKSLDIDGNNAYGSDGWMRCQKSGGENWPDPPGAVSQPSYATLALINGTPDGLYSAYMWVDQPLTPAASVADDRAVPWYADGLGNGGTKDLGQITMTADKTFRIALLGDIRADGAHEWTTTAFRIHQTGGGTADSGMKSITPLGNGGKWILFDITGVTGDVFKIEAKANTSGEADLIIMALDSVPEPSRLILMATGLLGLLAYAWRRRRA